MKCFFINIKWRCCFDVNTNVIWTLWTSDGCQKYKSLNVKYLDLLTFFETQWKENPFQRYVAQIDRFYNFNFTLFLISCICSLCNHTLEILYTTFLTVFFYYQYHFTAYTMMCLFWRQFNVNWTLWTSTGCKKKRIYQNIYHVSFTKTLWWRDFFTIWTLWTSNRRQ